MGESTKSIVLNDVYLALILQNIQEVISPWLSVGRTVGKGCACPHLLPYFSFVVFRYDPYMALV